MKEPDFTAAHEKRLPVPVEARTLLEQACVCLRGGLGDDTRILQDNLALEIERYLTPNKETR